jgi:hypothetical protein
MQLSLLLMDGLAEHVLLILSLQWNEQLDPEIKEMDELNNMKKNMNTLIIAAKRWVNVLII